MLEGESLAIWLELSEAQQGDYAAAKKEICSAMRPKEFVLLDGVHQCKLQCGGCISVFVHDLRKFLAQAMLDLDKPA